jgi:uncharacterized RDD family membrane protein YckC
MENVSQAPVAASTEKAGWWIRFIAIIVDGIILSIVSGIINLILGKVAGGALADLINLVIGAGYYSYLWSASSPLGAGQTVGMKIFGIRVVRTDGSDLTVVQGLIRWVGLVISIAVIFIGVIWAAFDAEKQGWHDKIAGTYVVKA